MKKIILIICVCISTLAAIFGCVIFKKLHQDIIFDDYVNINGLIEQYQWIDVNDTKKIQTAVDYINHMYKREAPSNIEVDSPTIFLTFTDADGKQEDFELYGDCLVYDDKFYRVFPFRLQEKLSEILVDEQSLKDFHDRKNREFELYGE